jgi:hypothetical protein
MQQQQTVVTQMQREVPKCAYDVRTVLVPKKGLRRHRSQNGGHPDPRPHAASEVDLSAARSLHPPSYDREASGRWCPKLSKSRSSMRLKLPAQSSKPTRWRSPWSHRLASSEREVLAVSSSRLSSLSRSHFCSLVTDDLRPFSCFAARRSMYFTLNFRHLSFALRDSYTAICLQ